jgi:hypothetical protein
MKTDDLIQRLGTELRPVQPLAPPWRRAAIWVATALAYVALVALGSWLQHGALRGVSGDSAYVVQQLALLATAMIAADIAFASVVPGMQRPAAWLPFVPVAILMATLVGGMLSDVRTAGTVGIGQETDWPCVGSIAIGTTVLWAAAAAMLRRGAALSPGTSGLLAGLAAVSLANAEACLTRTHAFSATVLLWHGATSLVVVAIAVLASRRVLAWTPLRRL